MSRITRSKAILTGVESSKSLIIKDTKFGNKTKKKKALIPCNASNKIKNASSTRVEKAEPQDCQESTSSMTLAKIEPASPSEVRELPKWKPKREHIKLEYGDLSEEPDIKKLNCDVKVWYPENWEILLNNIREMRKDRSAPVDSMGCDQCMDFNANEKDKRYQSLLSLMLSSQTKDEITYAAMQRLIKHGCSVTNILATSDDKLGELIYPVGFWKSKVKFIKKSTEMIRDTFDGDIPTNVKDLCKLSGVGPKMAHLCMKTAWGQVTGIGVDTHVHRVSNRLGWCVTKTPEGTQKVLEEWLPQDLWAEVNHLLVGFGQQICKPIKLQCATCLNYSICPYGIKELKL